MTMPHRVLILSQDDRWHRLEDLGERMANWSRDLHDVSAEITHDPEVLAGSKLKTCDVCVLCATMGELSDSQERGIVDFVNQGGALFGVHSATVADEQHVAYIDLIGGRFTHHSPYQEFQVTIEEKEHPITSGLDDFMIHDELYVLDREPEGARVLATALWEGRAQPLVYVKGHGQGWVLYNALGHDEAAFDHPAFQKLVVQGLDWACQVAASGRKHSHT
jgi:type 1 glutamine amidotransferase